MIVKIIKYIFAVLFLLNAIFWGLFPHDIHCKFVGLFGIAKETCPPHWVHVYVIGLGSFLISLLIAQGFARTSSGVSLQDTTPVIEEEMAPVVPPTEPEIEESEDEPVKPIS